MEIEVPLLSDPRRLEMHTRQRRRGKMKAAGSEGAWNAIDWV